MQAALLNNCRFVLSLAWDILAHFGTILFGVDSKMGSRRRFSDIVVPMALMAALITLLSIIVYKRDYQRAVAEMLYVFGSFLLIYILFVAILNFLSRYDWSTDTPAEFCRRAKSFVICLLLVHFDVTLISALVPAFRIAELLEFYAIYVSWTMTGPHMHVVRHRNAFGIISGASLLVFTFALRKALSFCFPNMPI